jgi:hypothetical protein
MSKRLTISISQIAPLIGLDNYNNFPKNTCELWRKYLPDDFKLVEQKLKDKKETIATSNEYNDIWEIDNASGTTILEQVKLLNSNTTKTSNDMVSKQDEIKKYINEQTHLTEQQKTELTNKVCSITNKQHGITNEDSVLDEFCRLSEKTIQTTQAWVTIPISIENPQLPIDWCLIGKYDGITTDNELVEAKMRQKALFKKVRDYENVQVQLYLHSLGFEKAYLVESYTNKKGERTMYVNEINYDSDYTNEIILDRLKKFISFFEFLMGNETLKEGLLNGDKDRKIFKLYETKFLEISF